MERSEESYYRHEPLDYQVSSVRLVKVLPALSSDGLIQCCITTASIPPASPNDSGDFHESQDEMNTEDSNLSYPRYICISYMWGSSVEDCLVRVNGQLFQIRRNLLEFLHVARQHSTEVYLWIDALCIDQRNTIERNHQVQQMGNIYARASFVLVWLGVNPELIALFRMLNELKQSRAIQNFEEFYNHLTKPRLGTWEPINDDAMVNGLNLDACARPQLHSLAYLEGKPDKLLDTFAKDEYWTRAWVTQEIFMARRVAILAGEESYPLISVANEFQAASHYLGENSFTHFASVICESKGRRDKNLLKGCGLINLLHQFRDKKCTIPRDRIYSLLPLCETGKDLKVDYNLPEEQLMLQVLNISKSSLCLCSAAVVAQSLQPWNFGPEKPEQEVNVVEFHITAFDLASAICSYCLNWVPFSWTRKKGVVFCLKMCCTDTHGHLFWEHSDTSLDPGLNPNNGMIYVQARRTNKSRELCPIGGGVHVLNTQWKGVFILRFVFRVLIDVLQEELLDEPGLRSCGNLWPGMQGSMSELFRMRFCEP